MATQQIVKEALIARLALGEDLTQFEMMLMAQIAAVDPTAFEGVLWGDG